MGHKMSEVTKAKIRAGRLAKLPTLEERFWAKVRKTETCWVWTGALRNGYGAMWMEGRTIGAHRISLILAGWTLPVSRNDRLVDHMCRNRRCVNPAHLRLVTPRVNATENNDSPLAINSNKTHCKHGHPLSGDNVRHVLGHGPKGTPMVIRNCITCYMAQNPRRRTAPIPNRREDVVLRPKSVSA